MQPKGRKYEVVAAVANAGRDQRAKGHTQVPEGRDGQRGVERGAERGAERGVERGAQRGATPMVEISDADYRTVHLPCEALEESAEHTKKGGRKQGD